MKRRCAGSANGSTYCRWLKLPSGWSEEVTIEVPPSVRERVDPFDLTHALLLWDTVVLDLPTATDEVTVEVVSPSTAARDRGVKRERYARFGVPEYWIVDAEAGQVEVFRLGDDPRLPAAIERILAGGMVGRVLVRLD